MHDLGVIHGRFQLLHNDHLRYLLTGMHRCRNLVIGITNPEPQLTAGDPAAPHRSRPEANPFTYYERFRMVNAALRGAGVKADRFAIVPFPINFPDRYSHYVPLDAVFFLTIYDSWGEKKLQMFLEMGLRTEILWRCTPEKKGLSAATVRSLIRNSLPWEHLVPEAVVPVIKGILAQRRI